MCYKILAMLSQLSMVCGLVAKENEAKKKPEIFCATATTNFTTLTL